MSRSIITQVQIKKGGQIEIINQSIFYYNLDEKVEPGLIRDPGCIRGNTVYM